MSEKAEESSFSIAALHIKKENVTVSFVMRGMELLIHNHICSIFIVKMIERHLLPIIKLYTEKYYRTNATFS